MGGLRTPTTSLLTLSPCRRENGGWPSQFAALSKAHPPAVVPGATLSPKPLTGRGAVSGELAIAQYGTPTIGFRGVLRRLFSAETQLKAGILARILLRC